MGPTTREGVLASLLLHACLIIFVLLFPDALTSERKQVTVRDPNEPIDLAFIPDAEEPPDSSAVFGDSGDQNRSDPRPDTAPPPENEDPYSVGNNPNRFVAPPMPEQVPAVPEPGPALAESGDETAGTEAAETADRLDDEGDGEDGQETVEGDAESTDVADAGNLLVPPSREEGAPGSEASSGRLKDAIGRMSAGLSGDGAPLRFHNPVGAVSGPVGGLSFDTPGFDWGPYARKIYWIIFNNWINGWPPAARAGLAGTVSVHFRIHKDGTLDGIEVISPSGTVAFDRAATLALEASSPLPPLPVDFPKPSEGVTGRFLYNMDPR